MERLHMIIIRFPQVLKENDLHLGINAKLDIESQKTKSEMRSSTQLCIEKLYRTCCKSYCLVS